MKTSKYFRSIPKFGGFLKNQVGRREPTVAYVGGWLGKLNLGDELLFTAYQRLFPRLTFWHYDGGRVADQLYGWSPRRLGGFLGGGTLIGQHKMWQVFTQQFQRHGDPFLVFGSGVANPELWPDGAPLKDWKPLLDSARFVGVRGPVSARFLSDAGIAEPEVVGDPAIVFARGSVDSSFRPESLVLNIGVADGRLWGSEEKVKTEMSGLARVARKAGWQVSWLVVWPKDLAITREAAEDSGTLGGVKEIYTDHEKFIDIVGSASVMVGMKLHATILGTCAGTPSIMLEYRSKCRDYMESIDHGEYVVRTDEVLAGELWERVQEMNRHRRRLADCLMTSVQILQAKQLKAARRLEADLFGQTD